MRACRSSWAMAVPVLALAACGPDTSGERGGDPEPPSAVPPTAASPTSIIREEVMPKPAASPLTPLEATVPFVDGGAALTADAERALESLLRSPQVAQPWPIVLRGHTDSVGHDEANLRVSRRRAEAVAAWLQEHGVASARIEIVALGEQRPVAPNALPDGAPDEAGRARNRRVTVTIAPSRSTAADVPAPMPEATREPGG